uniref:Uncharacterized protein n=1 Tax=Arundo donax TaxID=35708 RepID=A0A0A9FGY3_ARUDO
MTGILRFWLVMFLGFILVYTVDFCSTTLNIRHYHRPGYFSRPDLLPICTHVS